MKQNDNKKWLDELLSKHLQKKSGDFNFQQWQEKYPDEAKQLRQMGMADEKAKKISWSFIWRTIMKSPYTKFSTIAVGLIIISVFLFPSKDIVPTSVAWADVQKKMEEKTSAFISGTRVCAYDTDRVEIFDIHKYVSKKYGYIEKMLLEDQPCFEVYLHRPSRTVTVISHYRKQYFRFQVPENLVNMFDIVSIQGIFDFFCSEDVEKIGPKEIRGREVIGFVRTDVDQYFTHMIDSKIVNFLFPIQSTKICVWVDPKTSLPVFGENELEVGKGWVTAFHEMHMKEFLDHIDWDAELDENEFIPEIPEDYELFGMPEMKTSAVIGVSGTAAVVPLLILIRRHRKKRRIK